jgi:hypothetical protein
MADAWFVRMRSHLFNTRLDDEQPRVSFLRLFGCQDEFRPHQRRADRTLANALQADAGHPEFFHRTGLEQVGCVIIQQLLLFIYAPNRMSKHVLATLGKAIAPSSRLEEFWTGAASWVRTCREGGDANLTDLDKNIDPFYLHHAFLLFEPSLHQDGAL